MAAGSPNNLADKVSGALDQADWTFRMLVTGSRHATEDQHGSVIREAITSALGHIRVSDMHRVILVHGDAPGLDTIAVTIALSFGWPIRLEAHKATDFGRWPACGPRRNSHMVSLGASVCLAFPQPGSKGTWDCARKAADAGIPVILQSLREAELVVPAKRAGLISEQR